MSLNPKKDLFISVIKCTCLCALRFSFFCDLFPLSTRRGQKNQFCSHVKVKSDARISRCLKECNMWLTSVRTVGCDEARANKDEASMKRKTQPPIFFMQRTYPNVGAGECIGSTDLSVAVTDLY